MKQHCRVVCTEDPLSQSWVLLPKQCLNDTQLIDSKLPTQSCWAGSITTEEKYENSDILSTEHQIMAGLKVCKRGECTVLTGSLVSKARTADQTIRGSIHQALFTETLKSNRMNNSHTQNLVNENTPIMSWREGETGRKANTWQH